jgi:hypothetical protein
MKVYTVYAVFYTYENNHEFEAITTDFDKWLDSHNRRRKQDGNEPENEYDFTIYEGEIKIKENE